MQVKGACIAGEACIAEGMCGGCVWQGTCIAGGHAWQGAYVPRGGHGRGMHVRGACVAGETATAADNTHPTAIHSCF